MTARLATVKSQLESQTKINDKLQVENGEFKAGKAKQEKDIKQEDRNDKLESRVDELEAKNEEHATMLTMASDEVISLKAYIDELSPRPSPHLPFLPNPPPP